MIAHGSGGLGVGRVAYQLGVQCQQPVPEFKARRGSRATVQVADSPLRDATLGSDLDLRQPRRGQIGDELLPLHFVPYMYRISDIVGNGRPIVNIGKLMSMRTKEKSAFGQRMLEARKLAGLTQKEVAAKLAPLSQGTLSGLETDAQGSSRTVEFARLYGVDPRWLATGEGKARDAVGSHAVPQPMRNVRRVWVVGRTQGGMPERVWTDGDYPVGVTEKYAEVSTTDQHAFACRVVGDSMVPRYMPGEYALVEPGVQPELEDDVLVRLRSGETMLKRLLSRRGGVRLGSYSSVEVLTFEPSEITWMYYVAHPIPARRVKQRVDVALDVEPRDEEHADAGPQTVYGDLPPAFGDFMGGESQFGELPELPEKPKDKRQRGAK